LALDFAGQAAHAEAEVVDRTTELGLLERQASPRDAEHIANQAMARAVAAASAAAEALQAGLGAPETPAESQGVGAPRTDPTSTAMALQILAMAQGQPATRQPLAALDTNVGR